jgi:hypothetical protein
VENTLSKLQKVGDELAATTGHRGCSAAGAFSSGEIYLDGRGGRLKQSSHYKFERVERTSDG